MKRLRHGDPKPKETGGNKKATLAAATVFAFAAIFPLVAAIHGCKKQEPVVEKDKITVANVINVVKPGYDALKKNRKEINQLNADINCAAPIIRIDVTPRTDESGYDTTRAVYIDLAGEDSGEDTSFVKYFDTTSKSEETKAQLISMGCAPGTGVKIGETKSTPIAICNSLDAVEKVCISANNKNPDRCMGGAKKRLLKYTEDGVIRVIDYIRKICTYSWSQGDGEGCTRIEADVRVVNYTVEDGAQIENIVGKRTTMTVYRETGDDCKGKGGKAAPVEYLTPASAPISNK